MRNKQVCRQFLKTWLLWFGTIVFVLGGSFSSCYSPPCSNETIGPLSIDPTGFVCQHNCECNNQMYQGACVAGRCRVWNKRVACPTAGNSLEVHRTNVLLSDLCPALVTGPTARCPSGTFRKTCKGKGLQKNMWSDCLCTQTPCTSSQTICEKECSPYKPCACIDVQSDPKHCGECNNACIDGNECIKGQCQCPSPKQRCKENNRSQTERCVDLQSSSQHCGQCNKRCKAGTICVQDRCQEALLQPGSYTRGTPHNEVDWKEYGAKNQAPPEQETPHRVTLTRPFYLGRYEVTRGWFKSVLGYLPTTMPPCEKETKGCPVTTTLHQAMDFCNQLSKKSSLLPCYQCTRSGAPQVQCKLAPIYQKTSLYHCDGYRLPTDAEWEFAARAGNNHPFPGGTPGTMPLRFSGAYSKQLASYAWYAQNSNQKTHPVGKKQPNAWGLFDMRGNIAEWVWDGAATFARSSQVDPIAPVQEIASVRGGSYQQQAIQLRASARQLASINTSFSQTSSAIGFRIARTASHSSLCPRSGLSYCGVAGCIDTLGNREHCGRCGRACSSFQTCQNGRCVRSEVLVTTLDARGKPLTWTMGYNLPKERLTDPGCYRKDTPAHPVQLTHNFYAWLYEAQQKEFIEMLGFNPSRRPCKTCPVESVTWSQALAFANAMSRHFGLAPCYQCTGDPKNTKTLICTLEAKYHGNQGKDYYKCPGYRLPTEAEWEYMARDRGRKKSYCEQASLGGAYNTSDYNRYTVDFNPRPDDPRILPVGTPDPTDLGLYDLFQNVREWVWDAYLPDYNHHLSHNKPSVDPIGWADSSTHQCQQCSTTYNRVDIICLPCFRVLKGGHFAHTYTEDWDEVKRYYRHITKDRTDEGLDSRPWHIGFRVVRTQLLSGSNKQKGGQP